MPYFTQKKVELHHMSLYHIKIKPATLKKKKKKKKKKQLKFYLAYNLDYNR